MDVEKKPLVSVIVPCYNCERFVEEALRSVLGQTLRDIEVLAVDDCSTDSTAAVVAAIAESDPRLTLMRQEANGGVALARNRALARARGRYVAYLDSDDVWLPEKLEHQLAFMRQGGYVACYTSYETIEEDGAHRNYVRVPASIDYRGFLKNTITCSHTLVFDTDEVDRALLVMPDIRKGQDFATWLQVMKAGQVMHGLDEVLARRRVSGGSLSSNKLAAVRRTWNVYRNVERLGVLYSLHCLFWQLFHAVIKRIGR